MEEVGIHSNEFHVYVIEFQEKGAIVVILYQLEDQDKVKEYFKKTVVPMLGSQISGTAQHASWGNCQGLLKRKGTQFWKWIACWSGTFSLTEGR